MLNDVSVQVDILGNNSIKYERSINTSEGKYEHDHIINEVDNAGKDDWKFIICRFQSSEARAKSVKPHHSNLKLGCNSDHKKPCY